MGKGTFMYLDKYRVWVKKLYLYTVFWSPQFIWGLEGSAMKYFGQDSHHLYTSIANLHLSSHSTDVGWNSGLRLVIPHVTWRDRAVQHNTYRWSMSPQGLFIQDYILSS